MPISFRCPNCNQLLRVPDDTVGKQAKCPSCETITTVPEQSIDDPPADDVPPVGDSSFDGSFQNPYAPPIASPLSSDPLAGQGTLSHNIIDVGQVISDAWNLFKANMGVLVVATFVVFLITSAVGFGIGFVSQGLIGDSVDNVSEAIFSLLVNLINNAIQIFLGIGMTRMYLAAARGRSPDISALFSGADVFVPTFIASLLFGIAVMLGTLACIVPGIFLACALWLYYFLVIDRGVPVIESFSQAWELSHGNRMNAFVLGVVQIGIILIGVLLLCVGLLFAAPLVGLIWTVAYLRITGQPVSRPGF